MRGGIFIAVGHLHSTSTSHLQPFGGESFSTDRFRELPNCTVMYRRDGQKESALPHEHGNRICASHP